MQQIKYRQRHKTDPAKDHYWGIINGEHLEPYPTLSDGSSHDYHCMLMTCTTDDDGGFCGNEIRCTCGGFIHPKDSERFTGKLYKAGTEIYDGDEVRIEDPAHKEVLEGEVYWSNNRLSWRVDMHTGRPGGSQALCIFRAENLQVITRVKNET